MENEPKHGKYKMAKCNSILKASLRINIMKNRMGYLTTGKNYYFLNP